MHGALPRITRSRTVIGQRLPAGPSGPHGALPCGARLDWWQILVEHATDPDAPEIQAVAGVLATSWERHGLRQLPLTGLGAGATRHLLARWFPGLESDLRLDWHSLAGSARAEPRADEIEELVALLCEGASTLPSDREEAVWIAHALGQASLGGDHLWQDLHLPSRRQLSTLMARWFPAIATRNDRDMKWKKFLYRQLCDRAGLSICRAPSCGVCSDYAVCYGSEETATA
jgi:nitrogen fixation protein NifQ